MTALLFGMPGVLMRARSDADERLIERTVGGDERIWPIYHDLRPAYDSGDVSDERFWRQLQVRADLEPFDIMEAIAADQETSLEADPRMAELVTELVDADRCCGILANLPSSLAKLVRAEHPWIERVDAVTFSCDIGVAAPDPRAFAVAVDALGVHARDTVFLDTDPTHLAAAADAGLRAVPFTGPDSVREVLT